MVADGEGADVELLLGGRREEEADILADEIVRQIDLGAMCCRLVARLVTFIRQVTASPAASISIMTLRSAARPVPPLPGVEPW